MTTALTGRKAICTHVQRKWETVLVWIRERGFPAMKLSDVWESDMELIEQWRKKQIVIDQQKRAVNSP